jgi:hypothetical protein
LVKNPATQLLHRIRTIQRNCDIRRKKRYVLNRIKKGTQVRILRKTDEAFSKKIQKYGKTRHTVEGVVGGGTMVKIAGIDRQVRPWEIQVADIEETNPNPRAITSPDVETALSEARKARREGRVSTRMARKDPILKDARKQKEVSQAMVGRWVRSKDGYEGTVVRATKTGMWLETVSNGKKSDLLIRTGEPYSELASEPKEHQDRPQTSVSSTRLALVGMKFRMNDDEYSPFFCYFLLTPGRRWAAPLCARASPKAQKTSAPSPQISRSVGLNCGASVHEPYRQRLLGGT